MSDANANEIVPPITGEPAADATANIADADGDIRAADIGALLGRRFAGGDGADGGDPVDPAADDQGATPPTPAGVVTDDGAAATPTPSADAADVAGTADDSSPSAESFAVTLPNGETYNVTQDEAIRLLGLEGWARSLPEDTRAAFAAIENGQAAAVSRADFEAFQAWRQQQQAVGRPAPTSAVSDPALAATLDNIDDMADPEVVAAVRAMQQDNARLAADLQRANGALQAGQVQNIHGQVEQVRAEFEAGVTAWADRRGLDEPTTQRLLDDAIHAQVIQGFVRSATPVNPMTGNALGPPDMALVAQRAMDFALIQDPELHTQVLSGGGGLVASPPAATPNQAATALKRSRAASLASAPSAATSPSPVNVSTMPHDAFINGMADAIGAARNGSS